MLGIVKVDLPRAQSVLLGRAAFALWGSLVFVSLVFAMRGWGGAFQRELSPLAACFATTLASGVSLAALGLWQLHRPQSRSGRESWQVSALTVGPPMLLGIIISPAASGVSLAWVTCLGVGLTVCAQLVVRDSAQKVEPDDQSVMDDQSPTIPIAGATSPDVTQWMTRRRITDQGDTWDTVEGQTSVDFEPGQNNATVHLSICPPMLTVPEIECEVPDHPQLEWKVAAQHPYGIRLEVRRPAPISEPLNARIGYTLAACIQPDRKAG